MVARIRVPLPVDGASSVYVKHVQRAVDRATVGIGVQLRIDAAGVCADARIGVGGAAPSPFRALRAEAVLRGEKISDGLMDAVAAEVSSMCDPLADSHGPAEYKRKMAGVFVKRALRALRARRKGVERKVPDIECEIKSEWETLQSRNRSINPAVGSPAGRARAYRCQAGMRDGLLRLLHGVDGRESDPFLFDSGDARQRARDPDHRRHGNGWESASDPTGFFGAQRSPMRILQPGNDHVGAGAVRLESSADARRGESRVIGESLPLHRLSSDHRRGAARFTT